jgi:hypothetical protein
MVNVSGEALTSAQASLVSKAKLRMKSMGWFFERIMKLCFRYQANPKADEIYAETLWADPEIRSLAEVADMVAKFAAAQLPPQLILDRAGFSSTEIEFAIQEIEKQKQEAMAQKQQEMQMQTDSAVQVQKAGAQNKPQPQSNSPSGKS